MGNAKVVHCGVNKRYQQSFDMINKFAAAIRTSIEGRNVMSSRQNRSYGRSPSKLRVTLMIAVAVFAIFITMPTTDGAGTCFLHHFFYIISLQTGC